MPHHPTQLRVCPLGEGGGQRVLVGGGVQANLDQLVVAQRRVDRVNHRVGHARVPYLDQGVEPVRLRAQEAALEAGEAVAGSPFVHGPHSRRGRAASPRQLALLGFALWLGVACATSAPNAPAVQFAPVPRAAAAPGAHPPLAAGEIARHKEPASLLDPAPPETASLLYARSVLAAHSARLDAVQREGVARALVLAEADHGLPVLMTLALITQESRFDPRAKGPSGSLGLMQLQPLTGRDVARRHGLGWQSDRTLLDPVQNVRIGLAYLAELRARFGSTDHAMAAYNVGPGRLAQLLRRGPLKHGPYLTKVHGHARRLQSEFGPPESAIGG
jgi:soluble lytic murein transglycosylase-like protein